MNFGKPKGPICSICFRELEFSKLGEAGLHRLCVFAGLPCDPRVKASDFHPFRQAVAWSPAPRMDG